MFWAPVAVFFFLAFLLLIKLALVPWSKELWSNNSMKSLSFCLPLSNKWKLATVSNVGAQTGSKKEMSRRNFPVLFNNEQVSFPGKKKDFQSSLLLGLFTSTTLRLNDYLFKITFRFEKNIYFIFSHIYHLKFFCKIEIFLKWKICFEDNWRQ